MLGFYVVISSYLLELLVFCKLQKINLLMVGEYIELLVLNCIYKNLTYIKITDIPPRLLISQISVLDQYPVFYRINSLDCT
ncbi:hypothetical protein HanPI659440_Chr00c03g0710321 [Helianthus annuus]|nr:hypothetical protein HanPI659440_Chr00c03g0710321 [Helianthus annuus]